MTLAPLLDAPIVIQIHALAAITTLPRPPHRGPGMRFHDCRKLATCDDRLLAQQLKDPARIHHRLFPMASGEMESAEFAAFLGQVCANMTAFSLGSLHFICIDWRHIGELLAAAAPSIPKSKTSASGQG